MDENNFRKGHDRKFKQRAVVIRKEKYEKMNACNVCNINYDPLLLA